MCVFIKLMEEVHRQAICCDLTSPLSLAKPLLFTRPQPSLPLSKQTCMSDNVRNLAFPYFSEVKKMNIWSEPYFLRSKAYAPTFTASSHGFLNCGKIREKLSFTFSFTARSKNIWRMTHFPLCI